MVRTLIQEDNLKEFDKFQTRMREELDKHYPRYGDSWKEMSKGKLYDRLKHKLGEFELTFNENKLLSLANLCMLLYIRFKEEPITGQSPEELQ